MYHVTKCSQGKPRTWTDTLVLPKQRKTDMRFGTWKVRSLCRVASLIAAARELTRYNLDLVDMEVRRHNGVTVRAGDYNCFCGKGNENHQLGTEFFVHHRIYQQKESRVC